MADDTKLVELACDCLFKEIEHLSDSEKTPYIVDINKETPYHVVMARKETATTTTLCRIFSAYPINPNLKNIHSLKPGEKRGNENKKNARHKRASDKRYAIILEAGKKFQNEPKKQTQKKATNKAIIPPPARIEPKREESIPTLNKTAAVEEAITEQLTVNQIYIFIKDELKRIKDQPASYFNPPPDYKRQNSTKVDRQPPSRQVSADGSIAESSNSQTLPEVIAEDFHDENLDIPEEDSKQFENCTWEVEFTENVKKFLANKKTPKVWKKAVTRKVNQIATDGIPHNHRLCGVLGGDIYETRFTKGGRILWEIVIQFSPRLTANHSAEVNEKQYAYSEVIRLWAIVTDHDNVERELKKIKISRARGQTASKPIPLFKKKDEVKGDNKRYPRYYTYCESDVKTCEKPDSHNFFPAGSTKEDEYNVVTFYSWNNFFVRSMLDGEDARRDFPFKEWPKEHDIINLPEGKQSILLLGRSGTGKTTCCLYRMWNQFHNYWSNDLIIHHTQLPILKSEGKMDMEQVLASYDNDDESSDTLDHITCDDNKAEEEEEEEHQDTSQEHLHQIFITKNYVLCSQMKKRFYDLAAGSNVTSQHMQFEEKDIPSSLCNVEDHAFPLFLTARQFFIILDNSLNDGKTFFQRDDMGNMKEKILSSDYDHEDPDTLLDLEESDSEVEYDEEFDDDITFKKHPTNKVKLTNRREVTAAYFTKQIWPKISKSATVKAKLDPLLVWMEVKSFIKGSQNAAEKDNGFLSQQEYQDLGGKMAANYAEQREAIYKIFDDYMKYVHHHSEEKLFDECDLIHSIYSRLNCLEDLPWSIHSVYVDEVQDFTQAELSILLRICRNPNDLFLTGDTAQSIMRGISFRFSELRYLFHCAKERLSKKKTKAPNIIVPKVKDLQINFRSHTGVLNLAASIIDVMKKCFQSSFDRLPGDEGMFTGPMPIVLDSSSISDLALVMHTNKRESSKKIEFGAHQVIIVQSEEAKQNIPDVLKSSIILTVFESKGLEFDDVLLFDFFKYSQVRLLYI